MFFSYAVITPTAAKIYVDSSKFDSKVSDHLGDAVYVRPYEEIFADTSSMNETLDTKPSDTSSSAPRRKFMISTKASWALSLNLGGEDKVDEVRSPIGDAKAIKNKAELEGMRQCHIRDGAALSEYFAWLEEELTTNGKVLDEVQAADELEQIRLQVWTKSTQSSRLG